MEGLPKLLSFLKKHKMTNFMVITYNMTIKYVKIKFLWLKICLLYIMIHILLL